MQRLTFDVRVAGGHKVLTNARLPVVAVQARLLARRRYKVWVRERTRESWSAGLVTVQLVDGRVTCSSADQRDPHWLAVLADTIDTLEEQDPLPTEEQHRVRGTGTD